MRHNALKIIANETLYQLSYIPKICAGAYYAPLEGLSKQKEAPWKAQTRHEQGIFFDPISQRDGVDRLTAML